MKRVQSCLPNVQRLFPAWVLAASAACLAGVMAVSVTAGETDKQTADGVKPWFEDRTKQAGVAHLHSNREAVGTRVRITVDGQERVSFVSGGNGFASQSTRRIHFGLADAVANDNFNAGVKAVASKDYQTALDRFEAALLEDPNNLRFGNEYRQVIIAAEAYERSIAFFGELVRVHPKAPNAWMNFGYAHVDKIPVEGAITQVILANAALGHFSSAIEMEETWLAHYTRGNSYVYWPALFGRTPLAIEDLEKAIEISDNSEQKDYHARPWMALGDCYWRLDNLDRAREIWRKALEHFPNDADLKTRLELEDEILDTFLTEYYDPGRRVDTNLRLLWDGKGQGF